MATTIKAGIIQTREYRDNQDGIYKVSRILEDLGEKGVNIVCLPEQWLKDNTVENYEEYFTDFCNIAKEFSMTIIPGAFYERTKQGNVISAPVIGPKGIVIGKQEKIHPFDYEQTLVESGTEAKIFETSCKFGIVICYDMVFPRVANILARKGAQILISPSRIVRRGISPWHMYVQVRALENRTPIIAANVSSKRYGGNGIIVDLIENDKVVLPDIEQIKEENALYREFELEKYDPMRMKRFSDAREFT